MEFDLKVLPTTIILLLFVAILITIGTYVEESVQDSIEVTTQYETANETFTAYNESSVGNLEYLTNGLPIVDGTLSVVNSTNNAYINPNNFTLDLTTGNIYFKATGSVAEFNNTAMKASYKYYTPERTLTWNTTEGALAGIQNVSSWQDTIALIIAAGVILSLVIGMFYLKRNE